MTSPHSPQAPETPATPGAAPPPSVPDQRSVNPAPLTRRNTKHFADCYFLETTCAVVFYACN